MNGEVEKPAATWEGEPERLDRVLPELGLTRSRSQAHEVIAAGGAFVDGRQIQKSGSKVRQGSLVSVVGTDHYVSRGAYKLIAALDTFGIDPLTIGGTQADAASLAPSGRIALDLGASTGGFTQVLLERGARKVLAVDVGHGQLAPEIRGDSRVRVVEGCNARNLTREELTRLTGVTEAPSLVVADLSFISLTLVLPAIARCTEPGADLALLIKPQFEVGRVKNGVVTDPLQWEAAIHQVLHSAAEHGFAVRGLSPSPIAGGEGNREFLVHFVSGARADSREWESRVREVCASATKIASLPEREGSTK